MYAAPLLSAEFFGAMCTSYLCTACTAATSCRAIATTTEGKLEAAHQIISSYMRTDAVLDMKLLRPISSSSSQQQGVHHPAYYELELDLQVEAARAAAAAAEGAELPLAFSQTRPSQQDLQHWHGRGAAAAAAAAAADAQRQLVRYCPPPSPNEREYTMLQLYDLDQLLVERVTRGMDLAREEFPCRWVKPSFPLIHRFKRTAAVCDLEVTDAYDIAAACGGVLQSTLHARTSICVTLCANADKYFDLMQRSFSGVACAGCQPKSVS
jgi:hypothetical protein